MDLAQFSQFVLDGQLADADVDLLMELLGVVWVDFLDDLACYSVQDGEHMSWFLSKPNGKSRLLRCEVGKFDLEGLLVLSAHFSDAVLVDVHTVIGKRPEERSEGLLNEDDDFFLLDPLSQWLLGLTIVVHVLHVAHAVWVLGVLWAAHHASVDSPGFVLFSGELFIVDQGCWNSCLAAIADLVDAVELMLGCAPLIHSHLIVVLVVHAHILVAVKLGNSTVVAEKAHKKVEFRFLLVLPLR